MSRAFTKEPDGTEPDESLPDRPVSAYRNLVTGRGFKLIEDEIRSLRRALAEARLLDDKQAIAKITRDIAYWITRHESAEVVPAATDSAEARFGHQVTIRNEKGALRLYRIVGEDEADPANGLISYVSPLAMDILGGTVGEVIETERGDIEIIGISP